MDKSRKIFVVSDIHGHYTLLKVALDKAGFDKDNEKHFLVCCGDYFDRGTENFQVLQFFERLKNRALLMGNHEELLLKVLQTGKVLPHNYINGTMQTLAEFFGKYSIDPVDDSIDFSGKTRMVERVCEFIEGTENYFETENYVFVHGWLPEGAKNVQDLKNANEEAWKKARWAKWTEKYDGKSPIEGKTLVCGHMPTFFAKRVDPSRSDENTDVFHGNGMIAIDAGTFDTKHINVLVLEEKLL